MLGTSQLGDFMCGHGIQKLSAKTPPKISRRTFWCPKNFLSVFFNGSLTGSGPEMTTILNVGRIFRPVSALMTCF